MTRAQLRTQIGYVISRGTVHDDLVNGAINLALKEISMRHIFRDMKSESDLPILVNAASVSLPSNTHHLIEARVIDGTSSYELDIRPKRWLTEKFPNVAADNTGKPTWGYIEGGKIYLYPLSDGSYSVRATVSKLMADLATDIASPEVSGIDRVIIEWAVSWCMDALEMFEQATRWMQRFEISLQQAIIDDERQIAVNIIAEPFRGLVPGFPSDYWLDPFFKMPGS